MAETMNDRYGDGSNHNVCPDCGLCAKCGDCICDLPGETLKDKMIEAFRIARWPSVQAEDKEAKSYTIEP